MNIEYAKGMAIEFGKKHPEYKEEIQDGYKLMLAEIEDGESEHLESEKFIDWINDLEREGAPSRLDKHVRDH